MDLIADRGRRVTVDELNTTRLLAHARQQAVQRKLDDMLIVDVDAHHYENEYMSATSCPTWKTTCCGRSPWAGWRRRRAAAASFRAMPAPPRTWADA